MNNLYSCLVERRNFGDLLSVEGVARLDFTVARGTDSLVDQIHPRGQSVIAIWSQDPKTGTSLPEILVCQDGTEGDWAAWITTFGAKIRPFSAFMRLVEQSAFAMIAREAVTPTLGVVTWPIAGLVLGEILAASGLPDKSLESMPANACESTLSFSMFRAAALHQSFGRWPRLVEAWEFVRQATRQHPRTIESAAIARVCAIVVEAASLSDAHVLFRSGDVEVANACREVITNPETAPSRLSAIPHFHSIEERMHGPREDRVVAFADLVRTIERVTREEELTSFMLGYLASRIAPGTIQHSSVLKPITNRFPTALLWYGFCAGLGGAVIRSRLNLGGAFPPLDFPASARRVVRDLVRPQSMFAAPTCDIGFLELVALSRSGGDLLSGLVRATQGTANVELAPGVWTIVNVSSKTEPDDTARTTRDRDVLAAMGEHLENLTWAYNDLLRNNEDTGQRNLFPSRRKKH